jgi:hypothetical protein
VRQSTPDQLANNPESRRRQYALSQGSGSNLHKSNLLWFVKFALAMTSETVVPKRKDIHPLIGSTARPADNVDAIADTANATTAAHGRTGTSAC